ncbi:MAG TPA: hypothetical protein ENJ18_08040 [Nannocystis exedens]|nr:hypothetical protein [Nannocystis exedens]
MCCLQPDYPCDKLDLVTECDRTLGAGSVFPAGDSAANKPCKLDNGKRYITQNQTNLSETFSCIAQVGMTGSDMVGAALVNAVSPKLNGPGGCNEGFLRDDALLMITMITDGSDPTSPGLPKDWYEAVVAAKGGDPEAIVMLLIGNPNCPDFDEPCKMAKMFPFWHVGDNESQDLNLDFQIAADMVEVACDSLIPQ